MTDATDQANCLESLRGGSKSFFLAAAVLPGEFRRSASALYAFCRDADDLIDLAADPKISLALLNQRLDALYSAQPMNYAADRELGMVVQRCDMPRALLDALFDGFAWDVEGRACKNLADAYHYSARVAGAVGAMMSVLMGVRSGPALARACDLGVAMQLTNIARDVGEDARAGRVYLPQDWLAEVGLAADRLIDKPEFSPELGSVVARLLDHADQLYQRAESGIAVLPVKYRPAIYAARLLYAAIGDAVRQNGCDSISQRAQVPRAEKYRLLSRVPGCLRLRVADLNDAALSETRFLVEAAEVVSGSPAEQFAPSVTGDNKVEWVLDLFDDLDRRPRRTLRGR